VFSSIESIRGPWRDAVVLDLYAGSGAVGLEALSRGALRVDLVDSDRAAVSAMSTNVAAITSSLAADTPDVGESAGVSSAQMPVVHVHKADVGRWALSPPDGVRYDVVFADPPYSIPVSDALAALGAIVRGGASQPGALLILERSSREGQVDWLTDSHTSALGLHPIWDRRFGEAHVWIAQVSDASAARAPRRQ
jgi:16S rRNA G966 N2-methylase RsmD